ncbi:restriction endonuclease subunit S [Oceanospirillaceae bacterium ASx5O]|nr:restriction endonuclease subunit S [Oceanospirillaceae bacterium ASx5O]
MIERDLKPGWRRVKFGDVVRQCKEKADPETSGLERYIAGEHMDTDDLRLRRWGEIGSGYLGPAFHMRFKPGQVLYGSRRTYLRKVAVADFEGICANTTFVLESKNSDELLPEFLPFLMQTEAFNAFSVKNSKGSVNPYINFSDLARFEFSLPLVEDQRAILELLKAAEACAIAYEEAKHSHEQLLASFIQESFSSFDEQHEHRPCKDLMNKITVGIVVKPADLYVAAGKGVRALRSLNVLPGRFVLDEVVEISVEGHASHQKSALSAGDIVIVRTGRPGDAAVVTPELADTNCIDLIVAKPGPSISADYVVAFLNSQFGRRIFSSGTTGTAQQHFNVGEFSKLKLPVPPIDVQREFVSRLSQLKTPIQALDKRLRDARTTKAMVLSSSICGA